ncbi:protoheme IX farnesyltransferase, mitochondrial-like [Saccostrea echinata]|uniref:protoheme IX farnesyltransferase, mitochondrial-like n=1 Tax=Saccostrea echinata TaxID=191078 RepID=UPI002A81AB08|nr:protoheme IX farnesyltransferase, mitochondrial-like [Saccostrea echinata]
MYRQCYRLWAWRIQEHNYLKNTFKKKDGLIRNIRYVSSESNLKTAEEDEEMKFSHQETRISYASTANGKDKFPQGKFRPVPLTLFIKKSQTLVMLDEISDRFTVSFPKSEDTLTVDVNPEDFAKLKAMLEKDRRDRSPAHNPESITECIWQEMRTDYNKLIQYYFRLSKIRLTGLVVLTAMAGYAMAPAVFDPVGFLMVTIGTGLTSASANAINQFFEVPFDSQMNRTKNRVLVRGYLSPLHAVTFAAVSGSVGLAILALGANPLTAALGAFNLGLYTLVYTPMKRLSIINTWVGSVVGAVPPLMGWAACMGTLDPGAWVMAAIMFCWQFPHFNALSWNLRPDYSRAGYRMMSVVDPNLCKRVALRHTAGITGLCFLAPVVDLTTPLFSVMSLPLNLYFTYLGWKFYQQGDSNSSRKLFRFSLLHIPILIVLMILNKPNKKKASKDTQGNSLADIPA